jgi:hypothetical protein
MMASVAELVNDEENAGGDGEKSDGGKMAD